MPRPARTEEEFQQRFWSKVDKSGECWTWTGATNRTGYGWVRRRPQVYSAHRLSYELANGPIPPGMCVMHSCDNPPCVRPDHLSLGTKRENNDDCTHKQRRRRVGTSAAKLTEEDVRTARALYESGVTQRVIAEKFGVTQVTISNAVRGRTYSYIPTNAR